MSERETMNQGSRGLTLALGVLLLLGSGAAAQRVDRFGDPLPEHAIVRLGTVRLPEAALEKPLPSSEADKNRVRNVIFTPDGGQLLSLMEDGLCTWDLPSGRLLRRAPGALPKGESCQALLTDGRRFTVDWETALYRLRDAATGNELGKWERGSRNSASFAVAPGARFTAVLGEENVVQVLDMRAGKSSYRVGVDSDTSLLALSADGEVLVWCKETLETFEFQVHRHAAAKALTICRLPNQGRDYGWLQFRTCVSPDCRWLVIPDGDGGLRRWDLVTGRELPALPGAQRHVALVWWSPDGRLAVTWGSENTPGRRDHPRKSDNRWWDMTTGRRLSYPKVPNPTTDFHFAPDGRTVATTDHDGTIRLWETLTGRERAVLRGHRGGQVGALDFRSDGRLLASGGADARVYVWDLTDQMPDGVWHTKPLDAAARQTAWDRLASDDATAAYAAQWQLIADPEGSLALLRAHLQPTPRPESKRVAQWIAALGSEEYTEREQASRELGALGDAVADELTQALNQHPAPEARRRLEALEEAIRAMPLERPTGRLLQRIRAVEVLEQIGTPGARELLRKLAEGEAGRVAREARSALERP